MIENEQDVFLCTQEHAQKNLKRSPLQKSSLHDRKLPKRHDHEIQHPQLVTSDKKPVAANNISMDTRLETAIEQLMDATKSHLLDKKMGIKSCPFLVLLHASIDFFLIFLNHLNYL